MKNLADVLSVAKVRLVVVFALVFVSFNVLSYDTGTYLRDENGVYFLESNSDSVKLVSSVDGFSNLSMASANGEVVVNLATINDRYIYLVGMFTDSLYVNDEFVAYSHDVSAFAVVVDEVKNVKDIFVFDEGMIPIEFVTVNPGEIGLTLVHMENLRVGKPNVVNRSMERFVILNSNSDNSGSPLGYEYAQDDVSGEGGTRDDEFPVTPTEEDPDGLIAEPSTGQDAHLGGTVPVPPDEIEPDGKQYKPSQTFNLVQIPGVGQVLIIR